MCCCICWCIKYCWYKAGFAAAYPNALLPTTPKVLASRIRERHTAEGFRQSVRLPRSMTSFWIAGSASRREPAATPSILLSRMKSSTSSASLEPPNRALVPSVERRASKAALSLATLMRPMRAALGFWQSCKSPRSRTARCTEGVSARMAAAARKSTSFFPMNLSTSSAMATFSCGCGPASGGGRLLDSRIRARQTAEGLRQSVRVPRLSTLLWVAGPASIRARAATSSTRFSWMKSCNSCGVGSPVFVLVPFSLAGVEEEPPDDASKLRCWAAAFSLATLMRPMSAALGLRQSKRSPRSRTARCETADSERRAAAARSSTAFLARNFSTSS